MWCSCGASCCASGLPGSISSIAVWQPMLFGDCFELIQQHGFADAAQAQHDRAFAGPGRLHSLDRHAGLADQRIAPCQLRGRGAGAWVVWVVRGFHGGLLEI